MFIRLLFVLLLALPNAHASIIAKGVIEKCVDTGTQKYTYFPQTKTTWFIWSGNFLASLHVLMYAVISGKDKFVAHL